MGVFKFSASLLHLLFSDTCCAHLQVYGSARGGVETSPISRSVAVRRCVQAEVYAWDCRAGLS